MTKEEILEIEEFVDDMPTSEVRSRLLKIFHAEYLAVRNKVPNYIGPFSNLIEEFGALEALKVIKVEDSKAREILKMVLICIRRIKYVCEKNHLSPEDGGVDIFHLEAPIESEGSLNQAELSALSNVIRTVGPKS